MTPGATPQGEPVPRIALAALVALALALRVLYLIDVGDHVLARHLVVDQASYDAWARTIAAGDWLGSDVFYQDPLYPYLLAVLYALFGPQLLLVQALQVTLSSLAVLPLYGIGRRLFGDRRVGLLAALLWATYELSFFFDAQLLKTSPGLALLSAVLWLLLVARDRGGVAPALAAGLALGLLSLLRANFLLVGPLLFLWLARSRVRRSGAGAAPALAAFALAFALVPGATALRNHAVSGEWVLTTAQGGVNFFVGNQRGNLWGVGRDPGFARRTPLFEEREFRAEAERRAGRRLGAREVDRFWYRAGLAEIAADPGAWLGRLGRKLLVLMNRHEVSDNLSYDFFRERVSRLLALPFPAFWLAGPFGLAGLVMLRRRAGLLALTIGAYGATLLLFYVVGRYRMPLVPPLLVCAAAGLVAAATALRERRWSWLAGYGALLVVLSLLAAPRWLHVVHDDTWQQIGHARLEEARAGDALAAYERALELNPRAGHAWLGKGLALVELGRWHASLEALERAVALEPGFPPAQFFLGRSLERTGQPARARDAYARALALDPDLPEAQAGLARLGSGP